MGGMSGMITLPRRGLLSAAALALMPAQSKAAETASYDYLFLDLDDAKPGTTPTRAYADHVRSRVAALQAAGGQVVGYFTPQLGWVGRQAALLVRWGGAAKTRDRELVALMRDPTVRSGQRAELTPTERPTATDRPAPGGIYVHRWFVVEAKSVPEFVALSVEGWRDFEVRFDTRIFGLFTAERSLADRQSGVTRLLLITRYGSHGVWEASRDPSTAAMAAFGKRQALTRDSWAASTLFVPL
jgi:hypothetical protein